MLIAAALLAGGYAWIDRISTPHPSNGNYPGSALITVTNFARPGIEIEIQSVGVIGDSCSSEKPCSAEGRAKKK